MQAFILVHLTDKDTFTFGQPVLAWVKKEYPSVVVLDVDAFSDERLVSHAVDLVRNTEKYVLFFKAEKPNLRLGAGFWLLEEALRGNNSKLILLEGEHQQIRAICTARPQVAFSQVASASELQAKLTAFFT